MKNFTLLLISLFSIVTPLKVFSEEWLLILKDFECVNERGKFCYIGLKNQNDNSTFLSEINIQRHAFKEFKLTLFVEYINSDVLEIFINNKKYYFKNNYSRGYLSKYVEEIITNKNIVDGYYSENHLFKVGTFERVIIKTNQNTFMIKIWDNLERLEFYVYYKDEKLTYNMKI